MQRIQQIYLFLIAAVVGAELLMGIIVAPTLFFPKEILGDGVLSHFQSGQLMTAIFISYNKALLALSIIILVYEMVNFNNNRAESFNLRFSTLMIALIHLCLALVFILYFTDYIVEAQKSGAKATTTETFHAIHSASEWCMKIMVILQALLYFLRFPKRVKVKSEN